MKEIIDFIINYYNLIILLAIVLFIIVRTKTRGYFWRIRKTGEELKFKDFLKRWKNGVEGITQLQTARTEVIGSLITTIGLVSGIISMSIFRPKDLWWWVVICLIGGLLLNLIGLVGYLQKYWRCKLIEEEIKKINERDNKKNRRVKN